jgi:hypothetical protein
VKITRFKVQSLDVQDIKWSPDNRHICAIDSPLEYRFFIYNLKGDLVVNVLKKLGEGRFLARFEQ